MSAPWSVDERRRVAAGLGLTVPEVDMLGQYRAQRRLVGYMAQLARVAAVEAQVRKLNAGRGRTS